MQFTLFYAVVVHGLRPIIAEDVARHQREEVVDDVLLLQISKHKLIKEDKLNKEDQLPNTGHESCQCLTESQTDLAGGIFPMQEYIRDVDGVLYNDLPDCDDPDNRDKDWLFPYELGLEKCGAYFQGQVPFCGEGTASSPRTWTDDWMCNMPFCLVDPAHCPEAWTIPGNLFPGMAFSYLTCATELTPDVEQAQMEGATEILKNDHRAYHCAGSEVDETLQADADHVEEMN